MTVDATILLHKECDDIDKANDWAEQVVERLQGHTTATFQSKISNCNPKIELTEEQESE